MSTTYTHHEIRAAILRAADRVEREPSCYDFYAVRSPSKCGTTGCMLGWIAFELGAHRESVHRFAHFLRTGETSEFWDSQYPLELCQSCPVGYAHDSTKAAAGMRAYADKYWPANAASAESAATTTPMDPAYLAFRTGLGALTGVEVGS